MPAPHPPEFRRRAIELARQGDRPVRVVAEQLSISESCLRNWMAQADADDAGPGTTAGSPAGSSSRLTRDEKRELTELRREKRRLEVENEILKRAAAYFARENILPK